MRFATGFLTALIGAIVANLAVLFALRPVVINPAMPFNALSVGPVVMFTVLGVVGATIVYAALRRFVKQPDSAFVALAVVVLLVSLIPDYLIIGQTTGMFAGGSWPTALVLMLMHAVTALIAVVALTKLWGGRRSNMPTR